ncbi:hypothetical protein [Glacieibacterium sp.]|uniref:hypothetical protein n=1 Tax=Glacieibacterium sp. TaxID=2860237 RepID=UPI003B00A7F6
MTLTPVQQSAYNDIRAKLDASGMFNTVTHDEVNDVAARLKGLSSTDADAVIDEMAANGQLDRLAEETVDGSWFGNGGLSGSERTDLFNTLATKLDGTSLASVSNAFAGATTGEDDFNVVTDLASAVATHATSQAKVDYVGALASETDGKGLQGAGLGGGWERNVDSEAGAIGTVLGSMRGYYAEQAFGKLTTDQTRAVLKTGIDQSVNFSSNSVSTSFDTARFQGVMAAASSIYNPDMKARIFDAGTDALRIVRDDTKFPVISVGEKDTLKAMTASMAGLLDSDTSGVVRELTYNTETQDGSDLAAYSQVMIATGQEAKLGEQMAKLQLGNDLSGDPIARLNETVSVGGQERRENAGALGYFTGAVYAGAAANSKDVAAQREMVTNVLNSVLTVVDKASPKGVATAASLGKVWMSSAVKAAISDPGLDPAARLERAALPQDPATGELGVGDAVADAFNTTLSRVQRTAVP